MRILDLRNRRLLDSGRADSYNGSILEMCALNPDVNRRNAQNDPSTTQMLVEILTVRHNTGHIELLLCCKTSDSISDELNGGAEISWSNKLLLLRPRIRLLVPLAALFPAPHL